MIDHFVHADTANRWASLPRVLEVRCACAPALARARYAGRPRHACHFDAELLTDSYEAWITEDATRPPIGTRLDVDTAAPVDIGKVVRWIRSEWTDA